jgi:hypothetical protein
MEQVIKTDVTRISCSVVLMYVAQSVYGAITRFCELCYELLCFIQTLIRLTF